MARAIDQGKAGEVKLGWVYDIHQKESSELVNVLKTKPEIATEIIEIFSDKCINLIIEAASQTAVEQYSLRALRSGKNLLIMSVGALANKMLLERVRSEATRRGCKVYIPSGAVLGIDGVKAAKLDEIHEAILTTRKPPAALRYSEYLKKHYTRIDGLKRPKVVFDGTARRAVKAFPASVNVAATLSLVGIGFDKTRVRIILDPKIKQNRHKIYIRSKAGEFVAETRNVPFSDKPRTSYLAALSAIRTLKNISEIFNVGT